MTVNSAFLATPITSLIDANGAFDARERLAIQCILADLRGPAGRRVFCAIERERWGEALMPGIQCTWLDYVAMRETGLVVAFPDSSYGVHVELGWASALGKPIIACINRRIGAKTPLVEGLEKLTDTRIVEYESATVLPDPREWARALWPVVRAQLDVAVERRAAAVGR
jgi:hypothetical protein